MYMYPSSTLDVVYSTCMYNRWPIKAPFCYAMRYDGTMYMNIPITLPLNLIELTTLCGCDLKVVCVASMP